LDEWFAGVCRERNELAEYWLPWCVDRDRPREIIRIADEPDRVEQGRQLKMADLAMPTRELHSADGLLECSQNRGG
jgi:hypothetical protein